MTWAARPTWATSPTLGGETQLPRVLLVSVDEDRCAMLQGYMHDTGIEAVIDVSFGGYDCIVVDGDRAAVVRLRDAATPILFIGDSDEPGATAWLPTSGLTAELLASRLLVLLRIARAERLRADLLAVVSHQLRGPLSAINVALDALDNETVAGDVRARYMASMKRSIQKADRLLDDLLTMHRIEVGTFQVRRTPFALRALLEQVAHDHELVADRAGVQLVWAVAAGIESISADRYRVAQALDNLIGNALEYAIGSSQIELSASTDGERVVVCVRDHGPGIPVDELAHVFDRDWQGRSRPSGIGLGLAIVRGIARAHDGDITATNAVDGGAVFTLSLPRGTPDAS